MIRRGIAPFVLFMIMSGCSFNSGLAPVADRAHAGKKVSGKMAVTDWRPLSHNVQKGDTLYGIALEYGYDYKELAELNGISPPYIIRIGQQLRLAPAPAENTTVTPLKAVPVVVASSPTPESSAQSPNGSLLKTQPKAGKVPYSAEADVSPPVSVPAPVVAIKPETPKPLATVEEKPRIVDDKKTPPSAGTDDEDIEWAWPAKGKVIATFNEASNLKGVDISGKMGQSVFASASGKVVYSGSGLRGYGKLVIIKHNKTYLSAYAHNSQILVKEGQSVAKGQRIAEMGDSDAERVQLHFEIRRLGKPVDPIKHLPESSG